MPLLPTLLNWLCRPEARETPSAPSPAIEPLEGRQFLSAAPLSTPALPMKHHRPPASATTNYLVAFYGLGGVGFNNQWLAKTADDIGAVNGYITRKYQESDGTSALKDFLSSIDINGDKIIEANEIAGMTVRVLGFSFGALEGANFTRGLAGGRKAVAGYKIPLSIPVQTLVTIDPVTLFPDQKQTAGPGANVRQFVNYYEDNLGNLSNSTMTLLDHRTHKRVGKQDFPSALSVDPFGSTLPSAAQSTTQIDVGQGVWADQPVTHALSSKRDGQLTGSEVNHETITFYAYDFVAAALKG